MKNLQEQVRQTEFLTKSLSQDIKELETIYQIVQARIEIEKNYQKALNKLQNSYQFQYCQTSAHFNTLFDIIKNQITHRVQSCQQIIQNNKQYFDDFDNFLRKQNEHIKMHSDELKQVDKELTGYFNKMSKTKDKYFKENRDFEQGFIHYSCLEINKESNLNVIQKQLTKNLTLSDEKEETGRQYHQNLNQHSQAASSYIQFFKDKNVQLEDIFNTIIYKISNAVHQTTEKNYSIVFSEGKQLDLQLKMFSEYTKNVYHVFEDQKKKQQLLNEQLNDKGQFLIYQWQPYKTFLSNCVTQIILKLEKKTESKHQNPELNGMVSQEFKDELFNYFKLCLDEFKNDSQAIKNFYQLLNHNDQLNNIQNEGEEGEQKKKIVEENEEKENNKNDQENEEEKQQNEKVFDEEEKQNTSHQSEEEQQSISHQNEEVQRINLFQEKATQIAQKLSQYYQKENKQIIKNVIQITTILFMYSHPECSQKITIQEIELIEELTEKILYREAIEYDSLSTTKLMVMSCTLSTKKQQNGQIERLKSQQQEGEQVFLQEWIMSHQIWNYLDLWESIVYNSIRLDLEKSLLKDQQMEKQEWLFQYKNLIQSNLLTIGLNMVKFNISKDGIKNMLSKCGQEYGLFELQIQEIIKFIDHDPKKNGPSPFGDGPNILSLLNLYYHTITTGEGMKTNESELRIGGNKKGKQDIEQITPRIFSFGGSKVKQEQK